MQYQNIQTTTTGAQYIIGNESNPTGVLVNIVGATPQELDIQQELKLLMLNLPLEMNNTLLVLNSPLDLNHTPTELNLLKDQTIHHW